VSRRTLYAICGLALVVVVAGYWFFLLSPMKAEIAEKDKAIAAEEAKMQAAKLQLASLQDKQKEAAANQAALIELAKMMPAAKEVPSLLIQIQDLATEAGISFVTVNPGQVAPNGTYSSMPLSLEFQGTFFDINDFLYRVEQLVAGPGRLLAVQQVDLSVANQESSDTDSSPVLSAKITLMAFQFIPSAVPTPSPTAPATPGAPTQPAASTDSPDSPTAGQSRNERG
jgi:Tfp pilus assembly protein PilO